MYSTDVECTSGEKREFVVFSGKRVGAKTNKQTNKQTKTKTQCNQRSVQRIGQHFVVVLVLTQIGEKLVHKTVEWYSFSRATKNGWREYLTELKACKTEAY